MSQTFIFDLDNTFVQQSNFPCMWGLPAQWKGLAL